MKGALYSLVFLLICGCVNTRQWTTEQYLLIPPVITGNKVLPAENFANMHRQKPNGKTFIFFSKAGAYQQGERKHNPSKIQEKIEKINELWNSKIRNALDIGDSVRANKYIRKQKKKVRKQQKIKDKGNWLMRVVGEKPVFFDSLISVRTAHEMTKLLKTKGFFQGSVTFETETPRPKYKRAVYEITERLPTFLGEVKYISSSQKIDSLIEQYKGDKLLKKGDYYNIANIDAERLRLEQLLRNHGFMFFSRQYINFEGDTTHFQTFAKFEHTNYSEKKQDSIRKLPREAKLSVIIENPTEGEHEAYTIDAMYMYQVLPKIKHILPDTIISKQTGIRYIYRGKTLRHEYHVLDKRMRVRPQELYNAQKIIDTQNSLNLLDMYKFVNVKTDTIGKKLHVHFFTNPLDRFQLTDEWGLNMAQGLPGPLINISWKNRNTFGGAEFFETSLRFLLDGQASTTGQGAYTSQEIGGSMSLNFPRILFPTVLIPKGLRKNVYNYNPSTKLTVGYGFTLRPEYTRTNFTAAIGYKGQLRRATYNFTLAELSIINTARLSDDFRKLLQDNQNQGGLLINSFGTALVNSSYFTYSFSSSTDVKTKHSYYFRILLESGGNLMRFLDKNFAARSDGKVLNLPYFQFWRINPTFHYYIPLSKKRLWAFRFNTGLAVPHGQSSVLPFEKYFFVGGGSSLRGWKPLSLGLGVRPVDIDSARGLPSYKNAKPAELIIEGNAEFRFPLYQGWIEGATFLDFGNAWVLKENATTQGGEFNITQFPLQLGLSSGFGIRMNLPFILIRADIGVKIRDPNRAPEQRWVLWGYSPLDYIKQKIFRVNVAIGYPF